MKRLVSILLCVMMVCAFANAFAEGKVGVSMPTKDLQRWNQDGENMQKMLEEAGYTFASAEIEMIPSNEVEPDAETAEKIQSMLDKLDDHDDVQNVYHNANLPEE